ERVPHPFDTHPTLHNRLEQLGFDPPAALGDAQLRQPIEHSWFHEIATAPDLEERLWNARQKLIQDYHSQSLAWRVLPKADEDAAVVKEHFPDQTFRDGKGVEATLTYDRVYV